MGGGSTACVILKIYDIVIERLNTAKTVTWILKCYPQNTTINLAETNILPVPTQSVGTRCVLNRSEFNAERKLTITQLNQYI